jgi:hypothetical protein
MPNRDVLWVLPNGTTTVIEVDDDGNPVVPIPAPPADPVADDPPPDAPRKPGRPRKQR